MKVRVRLLGILELLPFSQGKKEIQIDVEGATLKDLLHQLFMNINETSKGAVFNILNDHGKISPDLSITVNGKSVPDSDSLNQELKESDYIELFSSSGG